jgi:hypothetical protein
VAVVRDRPPRADAAAVALCPDVGERAEVFTARDGDGLAGHLAKEGFRVWLVDPWDSAEARVDGVDGVVREEFPALLQALEGKAQGAPLYWVGHGICGLLPVLQAARPDARVPAFRWAALGTRFSWRHPSPLLTEWIRAWMRDERPLPEIVRRVLFTGLRTALGPRRSSVPRGVPPEMAARDRDPAVAMEEWHRAALARPPPRELLGQLLRWFERGVMADEQGWVDYERGFEAVGGPALVVAGASDTMAPPEDVLPGFDRMAAGAGGAAARYRLLSRVNGHREEYGHLGMLLSRNAARDLDAVLIAWLRGREQLP